MMLSCRLTARIAKQYRNYHALSGLFGRILATDGVDECCIKIFQDRGHHVDFMKTLPENELVKVIGDYDGLVVRSATKVIFDELLTLECACYDDKIYISFLRKILSGDSSGYQGS